MKKLMVALSAAALALGARADGITFPVGECFNDATEPSMITSPGESSISDNEYSFSQLSTVGLPNQWALGTDPGKNLAVKTSLSAPAYYAIGEAQTMPASGQAVTPLYFDSLVKFTYCDEDATVPTGSDAKLMVWVKEDETAGTTNLMVTAGFYKAGVVQPEVKHYNCGPLAGYGVEGADDWCRLTIKAKGDITSGGQIPGFVVCVNGAPVTIAALPEGNRDIGEAGSAAAMLNAVDSFWHAENHLFPSMNADDTISAVGFAGQGAVDDISFAKAEPTLAGGATTFCVDKAVASITWPTDGSLTEVKVGDKTMTLTDGAVSVPAGEVVAVTATAAEGWMITGGTGNITPVEGTPSEITTAKIGVMIGDQKFATFADAIAYINGSASGDLVVNFAAGFEPEDFETTITPADGVTSLTIDLAGKTLTYTGTEGYAISCAVPLTITDSSEYKDGMIMATSKEVDGVIEITEEVAFTVDAGIIAGYVAVEDATCNIITGGMFAGEDEGFYLWEDAATEMTYGDKTYEATYGEGFWTVAEKVIVKHNFILMIGENEYSRKEFEEGADIDVPDAPTSGLKGWQTFTQWQYQDGTPFEKTTMGEADITLYAGTKFLDQDADENYLVQTAGDLIKLQAYVADGQDTTGKTFKLMDDINLGGVTWEGIGLANGKDYCTCADGKSFADFKAGAFAGIFDGNGRTISGVTIKGGDYNGFFNSTYKATITNLKLGIANNGVAETSASSDALFVGVAFDSELSNLEAVKGEDTGTTTFTTGKDAAIIVGYMAGGMVSNCVNNLNVQTSPTATDRKAGGIVLITQNSGTDKESETASPALIVDCVNKGAIATSNQGTAGVAGILGYVGMATTLKNVVNNGNVSTTGGTAYSIFGNDAWKDSNDHSKGKWLLTIEGANEAQDTYMAGNTAIDGLNFATVDADGIAKFVKDAAVVEAATAADATYKVMSPIASFAYQFSGDAGEIAFLTGLKAPTFTITDKSGNAVDQTAMEGGVKYVVAAQQGWPKNPADYSDKPAKDIPGVKLPTALENVDGATLITWATGVGAVDFAAADAIKTDAFLLNIANSSDAASVQAEKAAFKITSITQESDGSWTVTAVQQNTDGKAYNGQVVIKGSETLEDPEWDASNVEGPFFKAFLEIVTVPDVE